MSEEYQRTARALARETEMNPASAARIEAALLRAMTSREGGAVSWRAWLSAAAAILLIAGALFVWQTNRPVATTETTVTSAISKTNAPESPSTEKATDRTPVVPVTAATSRASRPSGKTPRRASATVVHPAGFVELPWTAGLPVFESGEIVRMEVPVASLPAYGIDISAGADRPVEADILIGQDGFARAIRLVTNSARSVQ